MKTKRRIPVISRSSDAIRGRSSCYHNNMLLLEVSFVLSTAVALVVCNQGSQSSVFDQCGPRHTNLTQECVGKLILDTLVKVTADPENFFGSNVSMGPAIISFGRAITSFRQNAYLNINKMIHFWM